ncbi:uncharacterized protein LOC125761287 isoform X1 [Anopheles funestus]|uniref:uncharacterized protein LOC125761287 isoform X1 n=1 Tax=Anopheles funestus TaxID=62324 RepID=UPI0020C63800|nr:uncharacterized protein LOC125761287 isoform X1 [Anopheles funestus]
MEHAHQLVKVTNFMLHLMLLLPLQTTTTSSGSGGNPPMNTNAIVGASGVAGKSSTDFVGPIGTIASSGRERSHLKGTGGCNRVVFSSSRIRNGSIAPSHSKHSGLFPSSLCQLYEFVGDGAERVQIIFSEFRLPSKLGPTECGDTDILMVINFHLHTIPSVWHRTVLVFYPNACQTNDLLPRVWFTTSLTTARSWWKHSAVTHFLSRYFPTVHGYCWNYAAATTIRKTRDLREIFSFSQILAYLPDINRTSLSAPFTTFGTSPAKDGFSHRTSPELIQETSSVTISFTADPTISSTCVSHTSTSKEYDPATRTLPAITWSFLILSRAIANTPCTVVTGVSLWYARMAVSFALRWHRTIVWMGPGFGHCTRSKRYRSRRRSGSRKRRLARSLRPVPPAGCAAYCTRLHCLRQLPQLPA